MDRLIVLSELFNFKAEAVDAAKSIFGCGGYKDR
jgi:hypothetical protein